MKNKQSMLTTIGLFFLCFFTFGATSTAQEIATNSVNNQSGLTSIVFSALSGPAQEATATQLLDNPIVTFLLEHLKINKPTVFAIGITIIGIIFLLMALFFPSLAKQQQRQKINQTPTSLRQNKRRKKVSAKGIIAIIGLIFVLIGVVVQTFNQVY